MSKSETNNNKRFRTAMWLYLLVLALAASASFGWFIFNKDVEISSASGDDTVQIAVNNGDLEIFLVDSHTTDADISDDSKWGSARTYTPESQNYYIDISGDGKQLWYPRTLDANNLPNLNDGSVENITDKNGYYVSLKLLFRTSVAMDVYLASDSCVTPLERISGQSSYARRSINSSGEQPFSCDGIVGAARVAFLEGITEDGTETKVLKNLWIPNDKVQLIRPSTSNPDYSLVLEGESELAAGGYTYLTMNADGDALEQHVIGPDEYASGMVTVTQGWTKVGELENGTEIYSNKSKGILADSSLNYSYEAVPLLSFTGNGEMQYKTLYIRLWFEGTDREADSAFNGGMAGYKFCFAGIYKDPAEAADVYYNTANNSLCLGTPQDDDYNTAGATPANNLEYSMDGISWVSYQASAEGLHPNVRPGVTVYVRTKETTSIRRGDAVKLQIAEETNGEE